MNKVNKYFLKCSTPQQIGFFHIPLTFYPKLYIWDENIYDKGY